MTFLEALYGSQYQEIAQRGKDGNKGRLNANLFLSAFIIVIFFLIVAVLVTVSADFEDSSNHFLRSISGGSSGRSMGKLLAIPLLGIIYFTISKTVGSEENFKMYVDRFMQYPDEVKQKANARLLVPFFIMVGILLFLMLYSLHK